MSLAVGAVEVQEVEETDPSFVWTGAWELVEHPDASGGSYKRSVGDLSKVDITFTGTGIALIYVTDNAGGVAEVRIDGTSIQEIPMNSLVTVTQVKKIIATNLANTQHVMTIEFIGPLSVGYHITVDAVEIYTPTQAMFTISNISISPPTVGVNQPVTISADVTNNGELEGTYTMTLKIDDAIVDNKDVVVAGGATETISFTVSKDTPGVYAVAVDDQKGFFTVFRTTLTFRDRQGNAFANTSIYYGFSSGRETNYLGTTDNEGKITSDDPGLASRTIYFRTSDGKYAGSMYIGATGGEVTAELTQVSEFPVLGGVVAAVVVVAAVIGASLFIKRRK